MKKTYNLRLFNMYNYVFIKVIIKVIIKKFSNNLDYVYVKEYISMDLCH